MVKEHRRDIEVVPNLICDIHIHLAYMPTMFEGNLPVPTMVHTLVSPISTCHRAPDDAPESWEEPRRPDDADPAELGRRRPLVTGFLEIPPLPLEVDRFCFFTRPPSLVKKSGEVGDGDAGTLSPVPVLKYSVPEADTGVLTTGEPGRGGEFESGFNEVFHCLPSIGRYVFTFSPMQDKKAPVGPGVPGSGMPLLPSYTSNAILCN